MMTHATILGFPRIGSERELKNAAESYWKGKLGRDALLETGRALRRRHWQMQQEAGLTQVPCNDFSLYDQMLDAICLVGAVPERFGHRAGDVELDTCFAMARGAQHAGLDARAMEMTKWFDTNYHYIVPELRRGMRFRLAGSKPFDELAEARALGLEARPVLVGPWSFLLLGKAKEEGLDPLTLLEPLLEVYSEIVSRLARAGAAWIQLDEPCLVQDRTSAEIAALERAYARLADAKGPARLLVATYFGPVGDALPALARLPVQGLALDLVRGRDDLAFLEADGLPADKQLFAGVVDGRNIWINDLDASFDLLRRLAARLGPERLHVASSCSLLHVPYDAERETGLDPELRSWLAFAGQKMQEIVALHRALGAPPGGPLWDARRAALAARRASPRTRDPEVRRRLAGLGEADLQRGSTWPERRRAQRSSLRLPAFPTTTVGSFPQTGEVRRQRQRLKKGELTAAEYDRFIETAIADIIHLQEELGLDVLVHGEFERTDMVEYFGEQLEGFAFTTHGWVQSYGSRCVRPPVIFGDVRRRGPMTVRWTAYAQSLTSRPVKGMLTGPITILQWSFVRDDQPRAETCRQLALAIRDEVADLEAAGTAVVQIDEPAIREGLPLRKAAWPAYLDWAVNCFRLASAGAADTTQIQTHMCYSHFGDILPAISALDADVILIENSRSDLELLRTFRDFRYDKDIGPGVYDIHSPRVPSIEEMEANLRAAARVLRPEQLWVVPDCGLKTRGYEETVPALRHMVEAARRLRVGV